jgi:hypothetical protein
VAFAAALVLLAVGSLAAGPLGLHLERAADLPAEDAFAAVHALADVIARRTGQRPGVDDPVWRGCESDDRCLPAIRARLAVDRVMLVRVYGGPRKKMRIACELMDGRGLVVAKGELDLPKEQSEWTPLLEKLASELVPEAANRFNSVAFRDAAPALEAAHAGDVAVERVSPWPLVLIGAGLVLAVTGTGFGASSASAKDTLEARIHDDREFEDLSSRQSVHGTTANLLWVTGAVAAAAGATWLAIDLASQP